MGEVPNPGSDDALARGCLCPVLDNAHGRGAWGSEGEDAVFAQRADCPLHGRAARWVADRYDSAAADNAAKAWLANRGVHHYDEEATDE